MNYKVVTSSKCFHCRHSIVKSKFGNVGEIVCPYTDTDWRTCLMYKHNDCRIASSFFQGGQWRLPIGADGIPSPEYEIHKRMLEERKAMLDRVWNDEDVLLRTARGFYEKQ